MQHRSNARGPNCCGYKAWPLQVSWPNSRKHPNPLPCRAWLWRASWPRFNRPLYCARVVKVPFFLTALQGMDVAGILAKLKSTGLEVDVAAGVQL